MELMFGKRVRSASRRLGYLAGVEVDVPSRRVTKIIFSQDGRLGSQAQTRSIEAVRLEGGQLVVGEPSTSAVAMAQPLLLSRSVRLTRGGQTRGHVAGVVVNEQGVLETLIGRQHWWQGRSRTAASALDLSQPGEIRIGAAAGRAA